MVRVYANSDLFLECAKIACRQVGFDCEERPLDINLEAITEGAARDYKSIITKLMYAVPNGAISVFEVKKDIIGVPGEGIAWMFGDTHGDYDDAGSGIVIISTYRLANLTESAKKAALIWLVKHEIGHACGAADDYRSSNELYDKHCFDASCCMRQTISLGKLAEYSIDSFRKGENYCPHCLKRMKLFKNKYYG